LSAQIFKNLNLARIIRIDMGIRFLKPVDLKNLPESPLHHIVDVDERAPQDVVAQPTPYLFMSLYLLYDGWSPTILIVF